VEPRDNFLSVTEVYNIYRSCFKILFYDSSARIWTLRDMAVLSKSLFGTDSVSFFKFQDKLRNPTVGIAQSV
jgi:hypothetical protein